jgi:hypothetical protein
VDGNTYYNSGTYTNVTGCDTEVLNLTITPMTSHTTTITTCGSYIWSVNGSTYTTSGTYTNISGCTTEILDLTINAPSLPVTGNATQTLLDTDPISTIVVNPSTVLWYSSYAEAVSGTSPLPSSTIVTNGSTYYAVNNDGPCPSAPYAVTVTTTLSNLGFDDTINLTYYPNPTADILNISYVYEISQVSVTNTLGQIVLDTKTSNKNVQINLSHLPNATYFVKVVSEGKEKTIKIIKKE